MIARTMPFTSLCYRLGTHTCMHTHTNTWMHAHMHVRMHVHMLVCMFYNLVTVITSGNFHALYFYHVGMAFASPSCRRCCEIERLLLNCQGRWGSSELLGKAHFNFLRCWLTNCSDHLICLAHSAWKCTQKNGNHSIRQLWPTIII